MGVRQFSCGFPSLTTTVFTKDDERNLRADPDVALRITLRLEDHFDVSGSRLPVD